MAGKTVPVYAYDAAGRLVGTHPSIEAAAAAHGVPGAKLRNALLQNYAVAGLRWTRTPGAPPPNAKQTVVLAYSLQGALVASYPSRVAAARAVGCHPWEITHARKRDAALCGLRWRVAGDAAPEPEERPQGRPPSPTYAFDDAGRHARTFASRQDAAAQVGATPAAISAAVRTGLRVAGYRWSADADAALGPYTRANAKSRPVVAVDASGVVVGTYASAAAAARSLGVTRAAISRAVKTGAPCAGLLWAVLA